MCVRLAARMPQHLQHSYTAVSSEEMIRNARAPISQKSISFTSLFWNCKHSLAVKPGLKGHPLEKIKLEQEIDDHEIKSLECVALVIFSRK